MFDDNSGGSNCTSGGAERTVAGSERTVARSELFVAGSEKKEDRRKKSDWRVDFEGVSGKEEDGSQKTENGRQKTEDGRQRTWLAATEYRTEKQGVMNNERPPPPAIRVLVPAPSEGAFVFYREENYVGGGPERPNRRISNKKQFE